MFVRYMAELIEEDLGGGPPVSAIDKGVCIHPAYPLIGPLGQDLIQHSSY